VKNACAVDWTNAICRFAERALWLLFSCFNAIIISKFSVFLLIQSVFFLRHCERPKRSLKFIRRSLKTYFYIRNSVVQLHQKTSIYLRLMQTDCVWKCVFPRLPNKVSLWGLVFSAWWVCLHDVTSCFSACGEDWFRIEYVLTFTPHHTLVENQLQCSVGNPNNPTLTGQ